MTLTQLHYITSQWRRSVVKYGDRVSQVKPSDCFRLHPTSMTSKHSTIPVPDSPQAPWKISFTFHFWHKSFTHDDVKLAELSNKFWTKECDIFRGCKNILWPLIHVFGDQNPKPPGTMPRHREKHQPVDRRWAAIRL